MTVLVLGATGTTGSRVTAGLRAEGVDVRPVSRSTSPSFDWADPATHREVLHGVTAVYLLPPVEVADPEPLMTEFIATAMGAGTRRFVLLSSSLIDEATPGVGQVHAHLRERAPEWAVLRPSWFMQNFERGHYMADDARAGQIQTSIEDGRVAFVSADDIAAVAVRALLDTPHQTDHVITGPEALSYDDVARVLSDALGHLIVHHRVTRDEVSRRITRSGVDPVFASILAGLEDLLREGAEDRVTDTVERITGRPPQRLTDWALNTLTPYRKELA